MIVVFGSLNMDLIFRPERLPGAGETVLCPSYDSAVGGKGANQAAAAARAGAACRMVGCVGEDAFGTRVLAALAECGVDLAGIERAAAPTGCAAVVVDAAGENQIVVASGANLEARAEAVPDAWLGPNTTLVLQQEVPIAENWGLLRRARARGARSILNLAPALAVPPELVGLVDLLVTNEHEARTLVAANGAAPGDDLANARRLAQYHGLACIVTRGAAGALAICEEGLVEIGALPVQAVDSTGAGDAFVGALAAALDRGDTLAAALREASVAGALACTIVGAMPSLPDRAAIAAALDRLPPAIVRGP